MLRRHRINHTRVASLFLSSLAGGRAAVGQDCGRIAEGCCADLIFVNTEDLRLSGLSEDELLDAMVFATSRNPVEAVIGRGRMARLGREPRAQE